jgi:tripeptide aminopeptidase
VRTFGGSDANTFAARGRDTLVIANAMSSIHSVEEFTTVDELARLCALLIELMQ